MYHHRQTCCPPPRARQRRRQVLRRLLLALTLLGLGALAAVLLDARSPHTPERESAAASAAADGCTSAPH